MKKIFLFFALMTVCTQLRADSADYQITSSGPFIIIKEKRDFPPQKEIALRKAVVISVQLLEDTVIVKTSETEPSYEYKDKERIKIEKFISYPFTARDEKDAKKFFDNLLSQLDS